VVSAGSGTAIVAGRGDQYAHITGSAVGGGTLLGLARLLLGTADPQEIDGLALQGDPNGVDLSLADVIKPGRCDHRPDRPAAGRCHRR
jgi:type II pantothenate kinase